ncbi:MAG: PQQ-dependent sugar dehydrogenase [Actinomycetes bacterium]
MVTVAGPPSAVAAPKAPTAADSDFQQVTMAKGVDVVGEPMAIAVLPDQSVLHTARDGTLRRTTKDGVTSVAADIPVYSHDEDGLQGVAIDPDFESNQWVYVYYAPPLDTPPGDAPSNGTAADFAPYKGHNVVSRFKYVDGTLDLASEQQILQVPTDRGICCHVGGDIDFDSQGNLYLATGDDTNPFESDGYAPIDERATRNPAFDAQRTSANTNDLRGKILRIHVESDGSYTIPSGNLFAPGTAETKPEIYAMGFRNPFRFEVDETTGIAWVGEYGPDAGSADPNRGPGGQVEFDRVTAPGNYGWPYCTGKNTVAETYTEWDFGTATAGPKYDCANGAENNSPNNTGMSTVPPAEAAWLPYDGGSVPEFGTGSESPMGGPVYHFDASLDSQVKLPESYDGHFFAYEWGRGWIKDITLDNADNPKAINGFSDFMDLQKPMDLEFGPHGALYVLDYGSGGFFAGDHNSALYRVEYAKGNKSPTATITADPTSGPAPLAVDFSGAGSTDPDGDPLTYAWDFESDGTVDSTEASPSHTYTENGQYTARLEVTDDGGRVGSAAVTVTVGNTAPQVQFDQPLDGTTFTPGDTVDYEVTVTDPDGDPVDCSAVHVEYVLGHDSHGHPLSEAEGCTGSFATQDGGHAGDANIFGVLNASYTDAGGDGGTPPLTGEAEVLLQPSHKQAEYFTGSKGVTVQAAASAEGGDRVAGVSAGDWIAFTPYNLVGVTAIDLRVSGTKGGTLEVRMDAPDGPLVGTATVPNTGGVDTYATATATVTDPGGTHTLYLVAKGKGGGALFTVDSFITR